MWLTTKIDTRHFDFGFVLAFQERFFCSWAQPIASICNCNNSYMYNSLNSGHNFKDETETINSDATNATGGTEEKKESADCGKR